MTPGDVVRFEQYGTHHAVVLVVDPCGCVIIQATSHAHDMDCVEVAPGTREAFSLGWGPYDNRVSYFYASGIHVVQASDVVPLLTGNAGASRRCHVGLFNRLRIKAAAWVGVNAVVGLGATLLAPSPAPP